MLFLTIHLLLIEQFFGSCLIYSASRFSLLIGLCIFEPISSEGRIFSVLTEAFLILYSVLTCFPPLQRSLPFQKQNRLFHLSVNLLTSKLLIKTLFRQVMRFLQTWPMAPNLILTEGPWPYSGPTCIGSEGCSGLKGPVDPTNWTRFCQ